VIFFPTDSANVKVDIVFKGPAGVESRMTRWWMMFHHRGRWIRPSMSTFDGQLKFEEARRKADSAAKAEENEVW